MGNTELMGVEDILNATGLLAILFYFLTPTIIVILLIYKYNRHKLNKKIREKENSLREERFNIGKQLLENGTDEEGMLAIGELSDRPKNLDKFSGLKLEFDKSGNAV